MNNQINNHRENPMEKRLGIVPKDIRNKKVEWLSPESGDPAELSDTEKKDFFASMREGVIMINGSPIRQILLKCGQKKKVTIRPQMKNINKNIGMLIL
jgi:hypothetical protein